MSTQTHRIHPSPPLQSHPPFKNLTVSPSPLHPHQYQRHHLTDDDLALLRETVLGYLEIQRGGTLSYASGYVVVATVAGAEPAAEVAGFADGDAAEVGTYACRDTRLANGTSGW